MNFLDLNAAGMSIEDVMRPKEVGEQVVHHVLEDVRQPKPDFDAMKRVISDHPTARKALPRDDEQQR